MSKERLEEIVEKISEQTFDRIIVPQTKITIEYQDIKFLINAITKQTERVQELEDAVESYKKTSKHANISHKMAEEQNKRYREALDIMLYHADNEEVIRDVYGTFVGKVKGR